MFLQLGCTGCYSISSPTRGQVYVQTGGGLGFASYHFHHPGECYISYERANNNTFPKLDDGSQPPAKKYFEEVVYDPGTRCFRGVIDWSPSSWQGDESPDLS